MNVLFKCDKSEKIGWGHHYRCLALSEVFKKKGHRCFFLGLKPGIKKKNQINLKCQDDDLNYTEQFIEKNRIKIVIKDIYSLNFIWEKKIGKKVFLVVIDDLKKKKHFCHVYINYHFNYFKKSYEKLIINKYCKKLLGLNFVILRDFKLKKLTKKNLLSIFFYTGGADKNMKMLKLIKIMKNKNFDKFKKIFLLNKNHFKNKYLINSLKNMVNIKVFKHKINNFHNILRSSDLTISSGGVTMYEQILLRPNPVIFPQNLDQLKNAIPLTKAKMITLIKDVKKDLSYKKICSYISKKKKDLNLVNKNGKYLVYKNIISKFEKNIIKI